MVAVRPLIVLVWGISLLACSATQAALVQYWPLDDGAGSTAANAASGGNAGTLVGFDSVKIADGGSDSPPSDWIGTGLATQLTHSTGALDFSGGTSDGDRINGGDIGLISNGSGGAVTISMWLNTNSVATDNRIFSQMGAAPTTTPGAVGFFEGYTASPIADGLNAWDGAAWQHFAGSAGVLSPSAGWQHLALVWEQNQVEGWVDGTSYGTVTVDFDFSGAGKHFGIAARFLDQYGNSFDGAIDDVAIWDTALSDGAIAQLAAGASPLAVPEPSALVLSLGAGLGLGFCRRRFTGARG